MALIKVFASTATTFTDNGLGGIVPQTCLVYEELNGQLELSLTHPIDDGGKWAKLEKFNIIYAPTHRGWQPFRIYSVDKSILPGNVVVDARHIFYDLLGNFIEFSRPENMTCDEAGDKLLTDCQYAHGFTFSSDIAATNTAYYTRTNPVQALIGNVNNSFVNRWGGELVRDGYTIAMNSRIGADNGVTIKYRKNLSGLRIRESTKAVATRIYPIATGAGNTVFVLPEKYIDSAKIGDYPAPLVMLVKFTDIRAGSDEFPTSTEIYDEMRARVAALYAKGVDTPDYAFDVNMVDLAQTEEYKGLAGATIALGDDVTVEHEPLGVDMQLRVVAVTYNCKTGRYDKLVIGTTAPSLSNHVAIIDNDIAILKNAVSGQWFDEIAKNIIPCYESQVSASVDSYNIAITQNGAITKGAGAGKRNIAIGPFVEMDGDNNIAAGDAAELHGANNIAIGSAAGNTNAGRADCIYIGRATSGGAGDDNVVVIGADAASDGADNVLVGHGADAGSYDYVVLVGSLATALGAQAIVIGKSAQGGVDAVAIGDSVQATGLDSVAIGHSALATGATGVAIGHGALAAGVNGVAIGQGAKAQNAAHQIAIGYNTSAEHADGYSIVMGYKSKTVGGSSVAIGEEVDLTGRYAIALGIYAFVNGEANIAIGKYAGAQNGTASLAIGSGASANGNGHVVLGQAGAQGANNIAIGSTARINGEKNVLMGYNAGSTLVTTQGVYIGSSATGGSGDTRAVVVGTGAYSEGNDNTVLGRNGFARGDSNVLIPMGAATVYARGNKNIVIGNAADGSVTADKRILIGWIETGGTPLMTGHSDDGLTFNSQATDKTPLRAKAITGQTAPIMTVQDAAGNVVNGFSHDGTLMDIWGAM